MSQIYTVYHFKVPRAAQINRLPISEDAMFHPDAEKVARLFAVKRQDVPCYVKVAEVQTVDIEDVFQLTNHIDREWTLNDEVIWHSILPMRSTSVGDVVVDMTTQKRYFVASFGFEEF